MNKQITAILQDNRLDVCGVCGFETVAAHLLPCRAAARLPLSAQSVMVMLFPYAVEDDRPRNLSRYACVPDYHTAAGAVLDRVTAALRRQFPAEQFEPFMDNSPLPEVRCAVAAGLGVRGDNGLLISERYGSWVFIGCIVTTMALPHPPPIDRRCLHCGACAKACPGGCLPQDTRDTCVSALTQKKGVLTETEEALIRRGGLLWGCDRCQEVCPLNADTRIAPHPCFDSYEPQLPDTLGNLSGKAYGWRGEAVLRRNRKLFETTAK